MDNNSIKDTNDTNNKKSARPVIVGTSVGVSAVVIVASVVVIVALIILIRALIPSVRRWWANRQWAQQSLEDMMM